MSVRWVTIPRFSELTGYSENAVRSKIKRGQWREGDLWVKAPDGRVLMSLEGFNRWVEGEPQPAESAPGGLYLSEAEIQGLTHRHRPSAQLRELRRLGIDCQRRADGTVLVLRPQIEQGEKQRAQPSIEFEPDWDAMG